MDTLGLRNDPNVEYLTNLNMFYKLIQKEDNNITMYRAQMVGTFREKQL